MRKRAEKMNPLFNIRGLTVAKSRLIFFRPVKKRSHTAKAKYYLRQRPTKKKSYGNGQVVLTAKARTKKKKKERRKFMFTAKAPIKKIKKKNLRQLPPVVYLLLYLQVWN